MKTSFLERARERVRTMSPLDWLRFSYRIAFEVVFAVFTFQLVRPAFASMHLPMQDLPQHMAAISVLKRYAFDSTLQNYFELTLSRTQYLSVYGLGVGLSIPFGVEYASRLIVALVVIATPYSLRFALRRTGGDERFAALVWPFLWNPQMMLGFLNFLLGIPLALITIGVFAPQEGRTRTRRQVVLALLALLTFYSHLIPFGLMGLGVLFLLRWTTDLEPVRAEWNPPDGARRNVASLVRTAARTLWTQLKVTTRECLFLIPSLFATMLWIARSPARDESVRAGGIGKQIEFQWPDTNALPTQFRGEILNLSGDTDERVMLAWGLCLLAAMALSRFRPDASKTHDASSSRVAWLPLLCAGLYIASPASYGWIWPIHTRFAVAAVLLLPLGFARTRAWVLPFVMTVALGNTSVKMTHELSENFKRWDALELGDLDDALSHAQPGKRLVALVPAMPSAFIPSNVPLLHVAAYYQMRGGAVSTFTFADFPQSPFRYRDNALRPRKLPPRWEWQTTLNGPNGADPDHTYYDYVLTRVGYIDEPAYEPEIYEPVFSGAQWKLYARRH